MKPAFCTFSAAAMNSSQFFGSAVTPARVNSSTARGAGADRRGPAVGERRIDAVRVQTKSGRQAVLAQQVGDCSGDADIAHRAGAPTHKTPVEHMQAASVMFHLAGVDKARFMAGVRADHCWGGLVDMTQDRLPHAGERNGLYHAMGYSGHGTQMSVHMGQRMAETLLGNPAANPWRDRDWKAIPGHVGPPWFLPAVGMYYRLKDRFA